MIIIKDEEHFDKEFEAKKDGMVFAYFTAKWCGPCKSIAPLITELSEKHADKMAFLKIDLDDNPELCNRFNIASVPTFLLFKKGKVVERVKGAVQDKVNEMVKKHV